MCATGLASPARRTPSFLQNFAPMGFAVPQAGQTTVFGDSGNVGWLGTSGCSNRYPSVLQNFAPNKFSVPHLGQRFVGATVELATLGVGPPHFGQNFAESAISDLQLGQSMGSLDSR